VANQTIKTSLTFILLCQPRILSQTKSQQMSVVPIVDTLEKVYNNVELQRDRYQNMSETFKKEYGVIPDFFARAPGRVNLIGEHVDYSGYGVLPMALEKDVVIATGVKLEENTKPSIAVHISSTQHDHYSSKSVEIPIDNCDPTSLFDHLNIDPKEHHWTNYVLCGIKGILQYIKDNNVSQFKDKSFENKKISISMLLDGNVPSGSGLSSSSAVVCSSALSFSHVLSLTPVISKADMGSLTAKSEQFVGVQSGGMDQAISFLGERNIAMYITFVPKLGAEPVKLPEDVAFVVAHSLAISQKAQTAAFNYNRRVVECRLACVLLARQLLQGNPILVEPKTLKWLQDELKASFETMEQACEQHLKRDAYSMQQVADELGFESVDALQKRYFPTVQLANQSDLKLHDRALHVFTEAHRTFLVEELCNTSEAGDKAHKIGKLMNESHFSGRDLYEASCPELEELTILCRNTKGCLGSRFTGIINNCLSSCKIGAGWGGCTVSAVLVEDLEQFLSTIWKEYYSKRENVPAKETVLFSSLPSAGAAVIKLNN
jgi:N-acetylgalactosamine kinase